MRLDLKMNPLIKTKLKDACITVGINLLQAAAILAIAVLGLMLMMEIFYGHINWLWTENLSPRPICHGSINGYIFKKIKIRKNGLSSRESSNFTGIGM